VGLQVVVRFCVMRVVWYGTVWEAMMADAQRP